MKFLVAMVSILFAASAASAQTITFDPPPEGPLIGGFVRIGGYVEDGMVFEADPEPGSIIVEDSGGIPSNGTAFLSKCGICMPSLSAVDGGLFDLVSVDLGEHLFFHSEEGCILLVTASLHDRFVQAPGGPDQ